MRAFVLLALLAAGNCFGALTATITSVNQTQAILTERGFSGTCTVQVSTSPTMAPLHPDVNGTEYPGASTDDGRADTIVSAGGGTKLVTLGHLNADRALAAWTTYFYQVSGCGGAVTGSFTTANLSNGVTRTETAPFNSAKWANLDYPSFNWRTKQTYVDPMTGVTLTPMTLSGGTWRTGCGVGGCQSSSLAFTDWAGGAGWSNPAGILNGSSTNASTGNTSPLDLYADISAAPQPLPYDWHRTLEDVGVVVWGSATGSAAGDRTIDLCIFLNPASGCASNTVQVVLPTGSVSQVRSGSSDLDGAFPAAFPSSPFFGWTGSSSPLVRMENRETFGTAAASGSTLTLSALNTSQHFSSAIAAGQKIFVAGSGCTNSLCTAAGPPASANSLTVSEKMSTQANAAFRAYGWGIRVWKDNANGNATIGLHYKLGGSGSPLGVQSYGDKCSFVPVTSGDGKTGYLCVLTTASPGVGSLAFIANDGTTRILTSVLSISFDDTLGNVFYQGQQNAQGGWTVYKYTYTGDYTTDLNYNYTCSPAGDCPSVNTDVVGVDLMPHSANADLDQQIEANQGGTLPAYNPGLYGAWVASNPAVGYYGSSGHFAFFCNVYSGQGQATSGGPGWCAAIDLSQSPAKVTRLIHTLDGTGLPHARWGSLHAAQPSDVYPNAISFGLDPVNSNNTSTLFGGPFQAKVISILMSDGVTWSTNTCLDWPPGQGTTCASQSYYRACPANTSPFIECVTFRLPQNGVCNVAATTAEKTTWPCPWNSNYSQYPVMQAGDNATDLNGIGGTDSEHFRILVMTPDVGNTMRVVAARNATYDYCSYSPWHGLINQMSAQAPNQLVHANGWSLTMMPGYINACGAGGFFQDQVTGDYNENGRSFILHSSTGRGPDGLNVVTNPKTLYDQTFAELGMIPPNYVVNGQPSFHGAGANIGSQLQSYLDDSQINAGQSGYQWAFDVDPFVACAAESLGCGPYRTVTSIGGNVYKIQTIGSVSASVMTYRTQPMVGWAGRYQLFDVSGPSSNVDSIPYSMCFVLNAGECHAGSAVSEVYINVPSVYDPGYCSGSISWANIPCVIFGDNAPAGGIRQFRIYANDNNGGSSRFISEGWSSTGRHYPYTHTTAYPDGHWTMLMGTNSIDGFSMAGFMISLPPWQEKGDPDNDFKNVAITLPRGSPYAEVQFGYSRYIGPGRSPANGLYCTARTDSCQSSQTPPFIFASEPRSVTPCTAGCTINLPVVGPNVLYYQVRRSADGRNWQGADIQAVAVP